MSLYELLIDWGFDPKEFFGGAAGGTIAAITDPKIKNFWDALKHVAIGGLIAGYGGTYLANKCGITSPQGLVFFSFCIGITGLYIVEFIKKLIKIKLSKQIKSEEDDNEHGI